MLVNFPPDPEEEKIPVIRVLREMLKKDPDFRLVKKFPIVSRMDHRGKLVSQEGELLLYFYDKASPVPDPLDLDIPVSGKPSPSGCDDHWPAGTREAAAFRQPRCLPQTGPEPGELSVSPKVYVILVNWNGWRHTLECLESLFRQDYHPFVVVVCDNGSEDGSWDHLQAWAAGRLPFCGPQNPALAHLFQGSIPKPIPFLCYDRTTAEAGGRDSDPAVPLVLIQTGANLGFGGGNNVGLRYALARGEAAYVWLLNNDTVVEPDALRSLVAKASQSSRVGAVGSTILDYFHPGRVLSLGGKRIRWVSGCVASMVGDSAPHRAACGPPSPDYIEGCSCLIPLETVREVGLFDPAYFHFWEDVDLGYRLTQEGYILLYAEGSRVYHKEGASTQGPSLQADCYEISSCVIFFRKYSRIYPLILTVKLLGKLCNRIYRRQFGRIYSIIRSFAQSLFVPIGKYKKWK